MKVSFVIPLHNEERNTGPMLERLINWQKKQSFSVEIIAVNDKSTDQTAAILEKYQQRYEFIKPLHRKKDTEAPGNTMGNALKDGTKKASGDIIIWTMGDLSDDIKTYGEIIKKIQAGYDLVFASRYMPGGSKGNLDKLKAFLSSNGTFIARILFAIPVHDITNAFRGFKKEVFIVSKPHQQDFSISPEFAIRAHLNGYKLGEVPTIYYNRIEGVSNFKLFNMTMSYLQTFFYLFISHYIKHKVNNRV